MAARVFFYVQHLLGIGHLKRAATIARAMADAGLEVTLVSGGAPVPELDLTGLGFEQLPPVRATDLYFKELVDADDKPIDNAWRDNRRKALLALFEKHRPQVVMTELFPFGRRQLRFELIPLLEAAKARGEPPLIVSSVRDILVKPSKPGRLDEMLGLVEQYFDHVLIHGDPEFVPFERTFPEADKIAARIAYTGYVVDRSGSGGGTAENGDGRDEVIVSAGGGAVGDRLLEAAMAARGHAQARDRIWRVLVGWSRPDDAFARLAAKAPEGVIVERARKDFTSLLQVGALSISQGGYNTVMDVLQAGIPAVIVPYAGGLETEQTLRVGLLAERGLVEMLAETELDDANEAPLRLAAAVDNALSNALAAETRQILNIQTNGAETTARIIRDWIGAGP